MKILKTSVASDFLVHKYIILKWLLQVIMQRYSTYNTNKMEY